MSSARSDEAREYRRLYDSAAWASLRGWWIRRHPLCAYCEEQGHVTAATIVDHKRPHRGIGALFFDPKNLQSLCKLHHDSAKQSHEKSGVERGCDANGFPHDAASHWRTQGIPDQILQVEPLPADSAQAREKNPEISVDSKGKLR